MYRFNSQIIENWEFEANLDELKRQPLNQFGHMLPCFKEQHDLLVKVRKLHTLCVFIFFYVRKNS